MWCCFTDKNHAISAYTQKWIKQGLRKPISTFFIDALEYHQNTLTVTQILIYIHVYWNNLQVQSERHPKSRAMQKPLQAEDVETIGVIFWWT